MTWFPCFLAQFLVYLTIIPLMLDGYEMIIPNNPLISNKRPQNAELNRLKTPPNLGASLPYF